MFTWGANSPNKIVGDVPNIPSFFRGQHVLVTGATGFLGKAVIEKLLRCCSDITKIIVLLRQKKDKDPQKRLQEYLNDLVFERVKREKPGVINKVEAVSGDLMAVGLGLSPEDRQMLEENISVIFHSGASVRFDDPLKKALTVNTRGTLEIVNLAKKMKNLKVMMHISTAYCNCDKNEVEEIIYPAPCDWKKLLSAMDHVDDHTFNTLTSKILGRLPNTYTFTKALAEHVVNDVAKDLPVVICRPTIVIPALEEPFPGWVDNFNGPMGLNFAAGLALISVEYINSNIRLNCVSVDQVTNALLVAAWEKAVLSLVKLYRKIHHANLALSYFTMNEWDFKNENMYWLRSIILPEDRKMFDFDKFEEPVTSTELKVFILGGRRFLLKHHDNTVPDHLAHMKRMIWIVRIYYCLLCLLLCWVGYRCYPLYYGSNESATLVEV